MEKKPMEPYKFESLVVVTYGRSGSTLLMGILNTLPGVLIRGENYDFCRGLYHAYESLKKTEGHRDEKFPTLPFFGADAVNSTLFLEDCRRIVRNQLVPAGTDVSVWGFKEIRWDMPLNQVGDYLTFMTHLLPRPGLVFLTRNLDEVAASAWWASRPKAEVVDRLSRFEALCKDWSAGRSDVFWIDYADIRAITPRLRMLFDWIGAHLNEESILQTLRTEHSYQNKSANIAR